MTVKTYTEENSQTLNYMKESSTQSDVTKQYSVIL